MSDAIKGGGGSDPFAMFQQILDPLGIFKGIGGGVDQLLKQGSDVKNLSEFGKSLLNNDVASYGQAQMSGGAGGSAAPAAETSYQPSPSQNDAGKGWAQAQTAPQSGPEASRGSPASAVQAAVAQTNGTKPENSPTLLSAVNAQQNDAELRRQQKLKDEIAAMETEAGHMEQMLADFQAFDSQGWDKGGFCDSKFDRLNLQNVANDPNYPEAVRNAAKYLLDNPALLRKLAAASGGGSGLVVAAAVQAHFTTLQVEIAKKKADLAGGGSGSGVGGGSVPGVGPGQNSGAPPPTGTGFNPGYQSAVPAGQKPPESTLDGRLARMGQSLEDKQNELIALYNIPEDKLTPEQKLRIASLPTEIQKATNRFQQMHEMVSNILKSLHSMSMNSIGNIR